MKLSDIEAMVLVAVRLDADMSVPALARHLRVKETRVRHALLKLKERGAIRRFAMLNISALGYVEYDITCGLALRGEEERAKFFEYLVRSPQVSQVLETGGKYHCVFTVCAKTPIDVDLYLQKLGAKFGPIFVNESIGVNLRYANFPPKYLAPQKRSPTDAIIIPTRPPSAELDKVDLKVLRALSKYRDASVRDLARTLGMPVSTLNYRLSALQKSGILVGYFNQMEPRSFGHHGFMIYLSFKTITAELRSAVYDFCRNHPNVTYMIDWIGVWQCAIGSVASDASVASALSNEIYDHFGPSLNEITLFPILKDHKMDFFPFD